MSHFVRRIALLLLFVFTANVQCWAFNIGGDEMSHDFSEKSSFLVHHTDPAQQGSHDCGPGHHCCHALNHLLGQITADFSLAQVSGAGKLFPLSPDGAISIIPENIYHPPRLPSLI